VPPKTNGAKKPKICIIFRAKSQTISAVLIEAKSKKLALSSDIWWGQIKTTEIYALVWAHLSRTQPFIGTYAISLE